MSKLGRQLAFARNVPPRQIARRAWLVLLRRAERRLKPSLTARGLTLAADPPTPLFAPRGGLVRRDRETWEFRFVGRAVSMDGRIDWQVPGPQPSSQLWRMNLHYMEWLETLEDEDFRVAVGAWIEENPPYGAGSAADSWNAYSLSLRALVWMQQLALRRGRLDSVFLSEAERSLGAQLLYLERHLETDLGGNHLLKNIKALLWASAFFAGAAAGRWRRKGIRLLADQLPRQIHGDGMHFELSPSYHCQAFADIIEIRHALGGDPLGGALNRALARAAQAVADLVHPDGRVAQFGDSGLSMAYAPAECLSAYAAISGAAPKPRPTFALDQAGYYGARSGGDYVVVDAGPIAPAELPAHGHGDIFSFEWSLGGHRIVVDQGVHEYVAGPKRAASRTAASHNTLWLEGTDQAEFFGAFRCGRRARVRLIRHEPRADGFVLEASHDGFERLSGGPVHIRRVELSARRLVIDDRLEGPLDRPGRISLLLHPDVAPRLLASGKWRLTCGKAKALVSGSGALRIEAAAWWPDMGIEYPTQRLIMDWPAGTRESRIALEAAEGDAQVEAD
jgi:uncharacterized heparinase superfamily protein